jgi:hypothetical protein
VLYVITTLLHWAAWRWLARVAPQWAARYRRPALAAFIALYLLPFARVATFLHPRGAAWPVLAAVGMLWHLTIAMSMSVIGTFRAGSATHERMARECPEKADDGVVGTPRARRPPRGCVEEGRRRQVLSGR